MLPCLTSKPPSSTVSGFILLALQRSTVRARAHSARTAEVRGSSRKVRSRVHSGVKEPGARLLFGPPPPAPRFLPTEGCGPGCHSGLGPQQPATARNSPHRRTACLFLCVYESFPRQLAALLGSGALLLFPASAM